MTMTDPLNVITGAGTGIGRALALRWAEQGRPVLAIGRRREPLEAIAKTQPAIRLCAADVSTESGQAAIEAAVGDSSVGTLIHNAGVLEPVGPLLDQSAEAIRAHLAINLEAPIALTGRLKPRMVADGRIMHLSSGAAHRGLPGWGAYCISKAALSMAYAVLSEELAESSVQIASLRPGVVDTPMQSLIRALLMPWLICRVTGIAQPSGISASTGMRSSSHRAMGGGLVGCPTALFLMHYLT